MHFRQFIPIKPGRLGIRESTLAESSSSYLLKSKIYTGKKGDGVQRDIGRKAVMSVIKPYLDKGYYIFMYEQLLYISRFV